jgi:hypothetical protein
MFGNKWGQSLAIGTRVDICWADLRKRKLAMHVKLECIEEANLQIHLCNAHSFWLWRGRKATIRHMYTARWIRPMKYESPNKRISDCLEI